MNTLIIVTQNNLEEITAFSQELGERQKLSNSGKLLISGGYYLDDNILRDIGGSISKSFEVTELTKIQVSPDLSNDSQLATMFATFFMQRYTTVPGPWLIIDSRFEINQDNPISLMEKLHNESRQENSGRATTSGGGRVPIGPVVIGAEVQRLSTLRSVSGENWRSRGRWTFNVCSWNQISSEDYPFRVPAIELSEEAKSGDQKGNLVPGGTKVVEVKENIKTNDLPISNYTPPVKAEEKPFEGFVKVEMSKEPTPLAGEDIAEKAALENDEIPKSESDPIPAAPASKGIDNSHIPKPFVPIEPDVYGSVPKEILIDQVHNRTGRKPHPKTGLPKLIKALQKLDLEKIQE
jgi:hypothetical protein